MRGKKAKALRRAIYGDTSLRVKRKYGRMGRLGTKYHLMFANVPDSPRAKYQRAKRGPEEKPLEFNQQTERGWAFDAIRRRAIRRRARRHLRRWMLAVLVYARQRDTIPKRHTRRRSVWQVKADAAQERVTYWMKIVDEAS